MCLWPCASWLSRDTTFLVTRIKLNCVKWQLGMKILSTITVINNNTVIVYIMISSKLVVTVLRTLPYG